MRIIIEMQGAQSIGSRHRGIGRYSLSLSKEMARLRGEHEVILVLNGSFPESVESIRMDFAAVLPEENIHVWEAVGPVNARDSSNEPRRLAAEMIREAFLTSLQPDVVLTTSLFEGLEDDAITSIGCFNSQLPTAVILYDLIPLIRRSIYLQNPVVERWYLNKLDHLKHANLLLSISASSRQEAIDHLGIPPARVVNISTACDSHFRPIKVDKTKRTDLQKTYGLVRPFVMYTGGIDYRKNIDGLIRAYASLPKHLRGAHQLAVVCSVQAQDREHLQRLAEKEGLAADELVITGFVPEEKLLELYNLCKLFVFPSWHEGFGLPALEAMACGRAVIGANTSSVPEVIGREDALFDPLDDAAISGKIEEALRNDDFRTELERYGLEQAKNFSWEQTAYRAWRALEAYVLEQKQTAPLPSLKVEPQRLRLAYISPLPPAQSGISDYSAELLPALARHYEIEVIVDQREVSDAWVRSNCPIRDVEWFRQNAHRFDRVLYQFGNSHFHKHMFELLEEFPGVVVLHDFFLSGVVHHMDTHGDKPHGWAQALAFAHGWSALQARYQAKDIFEVVYAYPCNLEVLQNAQGVIVHSEYSRKLAADWYGDKFAADWSVIPLLRTSNNDSARIQSRAALGLRSDDFVICSFGFVNPTKLNHRLLKAWLNSDLAQDARCVLVFVGENHWGEYGKDLLNSIRASGLEKRIHITGYADMQTFRNYLTAADMAVQLRSLSRGETSAAVLDCMNYSLPTIVNAHGSMADLPTDAVWMLRDEFTDAQLIEALTTLWRDSDRRSTLGQRAGEIIHIHHQPGRCAEQYAQAIEKYFHKASHGLHALINAIADIKPTLPKDDWTHEAAALANDFAPQPRNKQLLLDISEIVQHDFITESQHIVRALLKECLLSPPDGWAVEPVYAAKDSSGYRYARQFTSQLLGVYDGWANDDPVDAWQGDIFLELDWQPAVIAAQKDYLLGWHRRGIKVFAVVYDLRTAMPHEGIHAEAQAMHQRWLETIGCFDGVFCISRPLAEELQNRLHAFEPKCGRTLALSWVQPGTGVEPSALASDLPKGADQILLQMKALLYYLMVGSILPSNGHIQTLEACTPL